eukprot:4139979-Alexandrium_andersonii.AAC.1
MGLDARHQPLRLAVPQGQCRPRGCQSKAQSGVGMQPPPFQAEACLEPPVVGKKLTCRATAA